MLFTVLVVLALAVAVLCVGDTSGLRPTGSDTNLQTTVSDEAVDALLEKLFPVGVPNSLRKHDPDSGRSLAIAKEPYDGSVPCAVCTGLRQCRVLNGLMMEEVYYPKDPGRRETCNVVEALGRRVSSDIFGNGRTFRDTEQCRDIVMQYLCLFYGSDNNQYRNYCVYQERVNPDGTQNTLVTARPPCRSFCVQVAGVCAEDPTFIQTCMRIQCPPTEGACTPDPVLGGKALGANLGCDVPYYRTPYNGGSRVVQRSLRILFVFVAVAAIAIAVV